MTAADQIVHDVKKRLANGGCPHMTVFFLLTSFKWQKRARLRL
jgi:hypothetical protein